MDRCSVSIGDGERERDLRRGEPSAGLRLRLGDRRLGDPDGDRRGGERPREREREREGEREPMVEDHREWSERVGARQKKCSGWPRVGEWVLMSGRPQLPKRAQPGAEGQDPLAAAPAGEVPAPCAVLAPRAGTPSPAHNNHRTASSYGGCCPVPAPTVRLAGREALPCCAGGGGSEVEIGAVHRRGGLRSDERRSCHLQRDRRQGGLWLGACLRDGRRLGAQYEPARTPGGASSRAAMARAKRCMNSVRTFCPDCAEACASPQGGRAAAAPLSAQLSGRRRRGRKHQNAARRHLEERHVVLRRPRPGLVLPDARRRKVALRARELQAEGRGAESLFVRRGCGAAPAAVRCWNGARRAGGGSERAPALVRTAMALKLPLYLRVSSTMLGSAMNESLWEPSYTKSAAWASCGPPQPRAEAKQTGEAARGD